jgi:hypothetical protein
MTKISAPLSIVPALALLLTLALTPAVAQNLAQNLAQNQAQSQTTTTDHELKQMLLGRAPNSSNNIFLGYSKSEMLKYFAADRFKHNHDATEFSWHGTDISTVLNVRYERCKVAAIRYTTHYGHPRPGKKSNVEISPWISAAEPGASNDSTNGARNGAVKGAVRELSPDSRPE